MIALVFFLAAQDPQISSLRAEEHSLLDQLDDALLQKQKLDTRIAALQREAHNLENGVAESEHALQKTNDRMATVLESSRTQVRALRQIVRGGALRSMLGADSMAAAVRGARMLARWLTQDVRVLSTQLAEARALDERRLAFQHNLEYARDVQSGAQETREAAVENQGHIAELLARVREERSSHERAYYESKEAEAKLERPSDAAVASDPFFVLRGHLPWPTKVSGLEPFGVFHDDNFGTAVQRSGVRLRGYANVTAVAAGQVSFADTIAGLGKVVVIEHTPYFTTVYAGLESLFVKKGANLSAATLLGRSSGMLDFEIRRGVVPEDPQPWFQP